MSKDSSGKFRTFEDLDCWQACRKLRVFAAGICKNLKQNEEYRLRDQVLRAARRITASIAEGYGRYHYQETAQYCRIARGSAYEVLDHFITGVDEGLLSEQDLATCRNLVETSVRLLNGYIRYLQSRKAVAEEC
jgi:four helix bundle protein